MRLKNPCILIHNSLQLLHNHVDTKINSITLSISEIWSMCWISSLYDWIESTWAPNSCLMISPTPMAVKEPSQLMLFNITSTWNAHRTNDTRTGEWRASRRYSVFYVLVEILFWPSKWPQIAATEEACWQALFRWVYERKDFVASNRCAHNCCQFFVIFKCTYAHLYALFHPNQNCQAKWLPCGHRKWRPLSGMSATNGKEKPIQ